MPAPYAIVTAQAVPGNADVAFMARVRNYQGILVTQASLAGINWSVADISLVPPVQLGSGTFTVSAVWFDALQQNDPSWTKDGPSNLGQDGSYGYNFKAVVPYTAFPIANSGDRMQGDVYLTPVAGGRLRIIYQFYTLQVYQ